MKNVESKKKTKKSSAPATEKTEKRELVVLSIEDLSKSVAGGELRQQGLSSLA